MVFRVIRNGRKLQCLLLSILLLTGCAEPANPNSEISSSTASSTSWENENRTEETALAVDTTQQEALTTKTSDRPAATNGSQTTISTAATSVTKPAEGRPIRIACVGDSITEGVGASDKAKTSYPARLQEMLGDSYIVGNFGHGGTTVTSYFKFSEYQDSLAFKPDIVLISLGSNDCINMTDPSKVQAWKNNYENLLTIYQNQPSKPQVYALTALYRNDYSQRRWTLENIIVPLQKEVAALKNVSVIDMYGMTKDYFVSAFYNAGDRLHPTDNGYVQYAQTVASALTGGPTSVQPEVVKPTPEKVVYVKDAGSPENDGYSPQRAISNLAEAIRLCRGGGTVVICGPTTVKRTAYLPDNTGKITVTSRYDAVDYQASGAKLTFTGTEKLNQGLFLSGDYLFENLTLECGHNNVRMVMNYHNVTIGDGVTCRLVGNATAYIGLVCGYDVASLLQTDEELTLTGECRVTVKSGTFAFLYGGNLRRTAVLPDADQKRVNTAQYPYGGIGASGRLLLTMDGGQFTGTDVLSIGFGPCAGEGSLVINEGVFDYPAMQLACWPGNHLSVGKVPPITGRIYLQIRGGTFRSGTLQIQPSDGPAFQGQAEISISGGTFTGLSSLTGVVGARLRLTQSYRRFQTLASGFDTIIIE